MTSSTTSGDRLEEAVFRPVQVAYGRAQRTHAGFAQRHGLPSRSFEEASAGVSPAGARGFIDMPLGAVGEAELTLSTLQDSMLPVEAGDEELRAGLAGGTGPDRGRHERRPRVHPHARPLIRPGSARARAGRRPVDGTGIDAVSSGSGGGAALTLRRTARRATVRRAAVPRRRTPGRAARPGSGCGRALRWWLPSLRGSISARSSSLKAARRLARWAPISRIVSSRAPSRTASARAQPGRS